MSLCPQKQAAEEERSCPACLQVGAGEGVLYCSQGLDGACEEVKKCSLHRQLHERTEAVQAHDVVEVAPTFPPLQCRQEEAGGADETGPNEDRSELESQVTELRAKLGLVEELFQKQREKEAWVRAVNVRLRDRAAQLLEQMATQVSRYSTQVTELINAELSRSEESLRTGVRQVEQRKRLLSNTCAQADSLLAQRDKAAFAEGLQNIQLQVTRLMEEPLEEPGAVSVDIKHVCAEIERRNEALWNGLATAQRALRAVLNPSEVTLDPNTTHPSLILSEDLKTVTYTPTKQPYPQHQERFSNFLQVLSSQAFSSGQHCWRVEVEQCQWVVGVCYRGLARAGLGSALESSPGSWCLMWCDNLLRAFAQGKGTPLKRCTALQGVEMKLSYEEGSLSFYSIGGNPIHLHTFHTTFPQPLHLALRIMSGQPKSRITLCS